MTGKSYLPYIIAGAAGAVVASITPLLLTTSHADTKLLPFQGRLTDAAGSAIADGAKVVEFKMYDAPTGGNVKWAGEVHKLSINGGLVNTMLGSKASLGSLDFSTPNFLQITVDANGDGQISTADPPLLPRQSVIPSVFASEAGNSKKLAGFDWSTFVVSAQGAASNDPSLGYISAAKILPSSITLSQLQDGAVTSAKIFDGTLVASDMSASLQADAINPPGMVVAYAGTVAPSGWKFCDGSSQLRTDPVYSRLFAAVGTAHGAADGTHFNLPDYQGRFLRGVDGSNSRDPDRSSRTEMNPGGNQGNLPGSIQGESFKSHNHSNATFAHKDHQHWLPMGSLKHRGHMGMSNHLGSRLNYGLVDISGYYGLNQPGPWNETKTYANETNEILASDGGNETRPINAYVNYIIKL